jgi:hypothetical protein
MVYFTFELFAGIVVTKEELIEKGVTFDEDNDMNREQQIIHSASGSGLSIYTFPCCSKSRAKIYIIGRKVHVYYRKYTKCGQCDKYSVCDTCIGETNNGNYNVDKILDEPVKVNMNHICYYCFSDNRKHLGYPTINVPVVDGMCVISKDHPIVPCNTCGRKPDRRFNAEQTFEKSLTYRNIHGFSKVFFPDKKINIYYTLDDCLSCT